MNTKSSEKYLDCPLVVNCQQKDSISVSKMALKHVYMG